MVFLARCTAVLIRIQVSLDNGFHVSFVSYGHACTLSVNTMYPMRPPQAWAAILLARGLGKRCIPITEPLTRRFLQDLSIVGFRNVLCSYFTFQVDATDLAMFIQDIRPETPARMTFIALRSGPIAFVPLSIHESVCCTWEAVPSSGVSNSS